MALDPISSIVQGVGGIFQGAGTAIAASKEANSDDICGSKPGVFANKSKKEAYQACMAKASEARINAMNAQSESALLTARNAGLKSSEKEEKNKWIVPTVVGSILVVAIIITIIVVRRRKNK